MGSRKKKKPASMQSQLPPQLMQQLTERANAATATIKQQAEQTNAEINQLNQATIGRLEQQLREIEQQKQSTLDELTRLRSELEASQSAYRTALDNNLRSSSSLMSLQEEELQADNLRRNLEMANQVATTGFVRKTQRKRRGLFA
jgi:vacuolar-type H+-ATPase subunit I/STV1